MEWLVDIQDAFQDEMAQDELFDVDALQSLPDLGNVVRVFYFFDSVDKKFGPVLDDNLQPPPPKKKKKADRKIFLVKKSFLTWGMW